MHLLLLNNVVLLWIKCLTVNISIMAKTVKIKLVRSAINRTQRQKDTVQALGLRKLNHTVEKEATPQIMGMIAKVQHLVEIVE